MASFIDTLFLLLLLLFNRNMSTAVSVGLGSATSHSGVSSPTSLHVNHHNHLLHGCMTGAASQLSLSSPTSVSSAFGLVPHHPMSVALNSSPVSSSVSSCSASSSPSASAFTHLSSTSNRSHSHHLYLQGRMS